jgi:hypothetical protein
MPILMISHRGGDHYNHEESIREVGKECIREEQVEQYFRDYVQHCEKRVKNKEYAWANVAIVSMDAHGITTLKYWHQANPLREKVILNKPAQATVKTKKAQVNDLMEEIFAEEQVQIPEPAAPAVVNWGAIFAANPAAPVPVNPINQW